jgi:hypothetical protein
VPDAPLVERKSGFPFSTKEPEVYQGDIVVNGREADRKFVARKGGYWREDQFRDGKLWLTELQNDKRYSIDHERKIYAEAETVENGVESFGGLPFDAFRGKEHYDFDEAGTEGTNVRYKVRPNKYMQDDILIDVDTVSGMIVRQEFRTNANTAEQTGYLYELRNLNLNVDDSIFGLPTGFRKVSRDEFDTKADKQ